MWALGAGGGGEGLFVVVEGDVGHGGFTGVNELGHEVVLRFRLESTKPEPKDCMVFNHEDGIYASPDLMTREEAQRFINDFPKRFEAQGYYVNHLFKRIDPRSVRLEIQHQQPMEEENDSDENQNPCMAQEPTHQT